MSNEYVYRTLTIEDVPELTKLYFAAFNQPQTDAFFKWKYFENPFGETVLVGAFFGSELVGAGAMILEIVNNIDRSEKIFKFTDIMTHPNHQQKGISRSITLKLDDEIAKTNNVITYTIGSKISNKTLIRNNWTFIGQILYFFKPLFLIRLKLVFKGKQIKNIAVFDKIDNLLDEYDFKVDNPQIVLTKNVEYLKWRISNPNFEYKLLLHFDEFKKIDGYLIFSLTSNNLMNIIDFDLKTNSIFKEVFLGIEKITAKNKYKGIVLMTLDNTKLFHLMKNKTNYICNRYDFGPLKSILNFFIKTEGEESQYTKNALYWDFTPLNYDDI